MSVTYKVIQRGEPGIVGGGTMKYYASANSNRAVDIEELTKTIEKISTVSGADILAVLYSLVDVAVDKLANGNIVRLGNLGSLRITLKSSGYANADNVNASAIKGNRVVFTPGKKLKEMQKVLTYHKES